MSIWPFIFGGIAAVAGLFSFAEGMAGQGEAGRLLFLVFVVLAVVALLRRRRR
ncbi:MAG: hypothetical protein ACU0CO_10500 [Shimia sp.]